MSTEKLVKWKFSKHTILIILVNPNNHCLYVLWNNGNNVLQYEIVR